MSLQFFNSRHERFDFVFTVSVQPHISCDESTAPGQSQRLDWSYPGRVRFDTNRINRVQMLRVIVSWSADRHPMPAIGSREYAYLTTRQATGIPLGVLWIGPVRQIAIFRCCQDGPV